MPRVTSEKTRLMQVFRHLIGNGVKYMDKRKGRIEIGSSDEGTHWQFYVSDNGPGIDEKYHEKIFRMFQTLTPRDELESTGIGLAVVKKIVELFGGKVWLESVEGKGAKFVFTLPKVEDPKELEEPESSAALVV
jgi:signal transduction histidine kinase